MASELAALVAALPERQRLMLFLRYYADLDYREIARILDVKTGELRKGIVYRTNLLALARAF